MRYRQRTNTRDIKFSKKFYNTRHIPPSITRKNKIFDTNIFMMFKLHFLSRRSIAKRRHPIVSSQFYFFLTTYLHASEAVHILGEMIVSADQQPFRLLYFASNKRKKREEGEATILQASLVKKHLCN